MKQWLLKYLSIKDGLKLAYNNECAKRSPASKVPVHKRWIETCNLTVMYLASLHF